GEGAIHQFSALPGKSSLSGIVSCCRPLPLRTVILAGDQLAPAQYYAELLMMISIQGIEQH
ncbi:hypothetical protein, partial [Methanothrix soehngenii]|uniref:hypothetical protein n=1 Tax=Methanothrix soehngenii TaxID=2223 RepID=UPI0023F0A0CE|nr:hypothetical protein [Methanothrix soehngenii]